MADVESVRQRVQTILLDKGFKLELYKDRFQFPFESTTVVIRVEQLGERTIVRLSGLVAQYIPISAELKSWVCEQTMAWVFGSVGYFELEGKAFLEFRHTLLGDFLDPDELLTALGAVANTANDLDDKVKERFGGERWIDPHT